MAELIQGPDMTKTHRKAPDDESLYDVAEDSFTSEGGNVSTGQPEREREMMEFSIGYDGLRYRYNGYRYDRLADAVKYAKLTAQRPRDTGEAF